MDRLPQPQFSPWPHRLAVALALVTFPVIWVGGLVTTYGAGMAVPDWPGTYGYNLFRYPWQSWLAAPWNLFIEHGHRLLAASAGILSIALVVVVFCTDRRRWLVAAACGALGLVVFQGVLGGLRVLLDQRLVAMIHGCIGPLFFAYLGGLVVVTSRWWSSAPQLNAASGRAFTRAAWTNVGLAYAQLVVGALLRHVPLMAAPGVFRAALVLHLIIATALTLHIVSAALHARRLPDDARGLGMASLLLPMLLAIQLSLGVATYVAKYAFPAWLGDYALAAGYVIQEKSLAQAVITTAHVANGSLIVFVSVVLALHSTRLFHFGQAASLPGFKFGNDKLAACRYAAGTAA